MNFTKLKEFLDRMAATRTPGCAVTVYKDNQKVYEYAAGFSSLETHKKLKGDELFFIYSCSKIATVTAAAQLLERGRFLLSDPLYEYIPEYKNMKIKQPDGSIVEAKKAITIGDLFSMTAGFNYNCSCQSIIRCRDFTDGAVDNVSFARCMASEPLNFEPGEKFQYSLCHDILSGLVSLLTGMPFRDYVKENIFEPLDIKDTYYHANEKILERMAEQYKFVPTESDGNFDLVEAQRSGNAQNGHFENVGKRNSFELGSEFDSGGAGIITSVGEYAKLMSALACNGMGATGNRILSSKTVDLIKTNRLNSEQIKTYNWKQLIGYGYGLGVRTHIDKAVSGSLANLGEFGWGGAAGATAIMDTDERLGVFFVQHTLNPREEYYQPLLRNIVYACLDD